MGKNSAPAAPDYMGLAQEQAQSQSQLLQQQTTANRPDTTTPYGQTMWNYNPGNGQWSGSQTLNPTLQSTLETQQGTGLEASQQQNQAQGNAGNLLTGEQGAGLWNPIDYSGVPNVQGGNYYNKNAQDAVWNQFQTMQQPLQQQQMEQQVSQLQGQGLRQGDAAYDTAVKNLQNTQYQQQQSAQDQAVLAGEQEAQTMQGMDVQAQQSSLNNLNTQKQGNLNLWNSLQGQPSGVSGQTQITPPNAGQAQAPDLLGAGQSAYQAAINSTNVNNANTGSMWSGLGSAAMAAAMYFSDEDMKKDKERVGETEGGVPVYDFHYKGESKKAPKRRGVMAQDVEKVAPHAVSLWNGMKAVDYSQVP